MRTMRENIESSTFPQFVIRFVNELYPNGNCPKWVTDALSSVGITLSQN